MVTVEHITALFTGRPVSNISDPLSEQAVVDFGAGEILLLIEVFPSGVDEVDLARLWVSFGYLERAAWLLERTSRRLDEQVAVVGSTERFFHRLATASFVVSRWVCRLLFGSSYSCFGGEHGRLF